MNRESLSAIPLIKTPLGLLALTLLIIESIILGVVALSSNEQILFYIGTGVLAALLLIVAGVIFLAFSRPRSFYGQTTPSKQEIVVVYLPYSQSLLEKAEKQLDVTKRVESSLIQLFPKGSPEGIEQKEWNIISSLLREQSSLSSSLMETARQFSESVGNDLQLTY